MWKICIVCRRKSLNNSKPTVASKWNEKKHSNNVVKSSEEEEEEKEQKNNSYDDDTLKRMQQLKGIKVWNKVLLGMGTTFTFFFTLALFCGLAGTTKEKAREMISAEKNTKSVRVMQYNDILYWFHSQCIKV